MKEHEKQTPEYHIPFDLHRNPESQRFGFVGFFQDEDKLYLDIIYGLSGQHVGTIIRTAVNDSYSYKIVNEVSGFDGYKAMFSRDIEYNQNLYDPSKNRLRSKNLSVAQITVFAGLVQNMIREVGLENLSDEMIFENKDIRDILGLDKDDAFDYTPVKKTSEKRIPELV